MDLLDEDTISWLLDPNPDRNHARTGASHWKYPQASTDAPSEAERSPQQRRRCDISDSSELRPSRQAVKRREAKEGIDFTDLPETDLSKFKKPAKASTITAQFKDQATHLRSAYHGYDVGGFSVSKCIPNGSFCPGFAAASSATDAI